MNHYEALQSIGKRGVVNLIKLCSRLAKQGRMNVAGIATELGCEAFEAREILRLVTPTNSYYGVL